MTLSLQEDYRHRLYRHYLATQPGSLTDIVRAGLASRAPYLKAVIAKHIPGDRAARILDLGCGYGAMIHLLRSSGYAHATGVDRSPMQVEAARAAGMEGVSEGDLLETLAATSDASLDVVIAFDVIEHFTKNELLGFVDEVARVLKPGGIWLIHAPNAESPFGNRIRYMDYTHEQIFTRHSLAQLLGASGFDTVQAFEEKPVVHGLKSLLRRGLWAVFRSVILLYLAAETGALDRQTVLSQNFLVSARKAFAS